MIKLCFDIYKKIYLPEKYLMHHFINWYVYSWFSDQNFIPHQIWNVIGSIIFVCLYSCWKYYFKYSVYWKMLLNFCFNKLSILNNIYWPYSFIPIDVFKIKCFAVKIFGWFNGYNFTECTFRNFNFRTCL